MYSYGVLYVHTKSECLYIYIYDWFVIIGAVVQFVGTCNVNGFGHNKLKRPQTNTKTKFSQKKMRRKGQTGKLLKQSKKTLTS